MKPNSEWIRKRRQELLSKTSDAEKSAYLNLKKLGITALRQYPVWTGRRMYFADLYIPKYNILIEYNGEQHYRPIDYFGGEKQFEIQQEHDRRRITTSS